MSKKNISNQSEDVKNVETGPWTLVKPCQRLTSQCPVVGGTDFLTDALGRVGINRSFLLTLALIPFAANGLLWVANLVGRGYQAIAFAVDQLRLQ